MASYPYHPPSSSTALALSNQPLLPKRLQNIPVKELSPTKFQEEIKGCLIPVMNVSFPATGVKANFIFLSTKMITMMILHH